MISREVGVSAPTAETVVRRYHRLGRAGLFGKQWVKLRTRERKQLTQLSQSPQGDALKRVYAKVLLDASQGIAPKYLALQHKLSPSTVRTLLYRFENRRLAALEPASYGGREANKACWARVVEQWPQWVSLHTARHALGLSYQTLRGWVAAAQAPIKRGAPTLISVAWFRELIRNGGTSVPQASPGLLLPADIASRFGLPESVASHLVNCGVIRSKRIHGVFEYRLGRRRGAYPKDVAAYLVARGILFDLRKNPVVSEREIRMITGMSNTPVNRWLKLGKLPHYRLHWPAKRLQVRETSVVKKRDLEKFLKSRTAPLNVPAGSIIVRKRRPLIPPRGYLSLQEASRIAGVDPLTMRGWIRSNRVRGIQVACPRKPEYVLRVYPHRASVLSHMARRQIAPPPGLVTPLEASRLTEVSLHTVKSWIKSKRLRYRLGVINGRPIRFVDPSHVRALLQTRSPRKTC
jgi:transposase